MLWMSLDKVQLRLSQDLVTLQIRIRYGSDRVFLGIIVGFRFASDKG